MELHPVMTLALAPIRPMSPQERADAAALWTSIDEKLRDEYAAGFDSIDDEVESEGGEL